MNLFVHVTDPLMAHRLGWVLLHSIWQGSVVAIIYAVLRSTSRRCSAEARYLLACAALFCMAAAPILSFFYLLPDRVRAPHIEFDVTSMFRSGFPASSHGLQVHSAAFWCFADWHRFFDPVVPWLAVTWVGGVTLLSIRWLQGYRWVRHLSTVQTMPLDAAGLELLEDLKVRFNVSRPVRLVSSALAEVPMVIGWLRPVILVPASSLTGLTPAQLQAILAHELAHVRRCDYLVNSFQNLVETVMFYHPAVWWISRCIREEREHCCDDMVVRICQDRLMYARALFRLEELRGTPARLAFAASGGSLVDRIRRLVAAGKAGPITAREIGGLVLGAIGGILVLLGCFLLLGAESYSSTVRMKIEHAYAAPLAPRQNGLSYDSYSLQTEFEVIQSEVILGKAIEDLNLDKEWSRKYGRVLKPFESVELLRRQLDIRPVRNTSILELRVYDPSAVRAADIANKIAETYRDFRKDEISGRPNERLEVLLKQLKEQETAIAELRNTMEQQRNLLQIQDNSQSNEASYPRISAEALRKVEEVRIESQAEYLRSKTLLDQLKTLTPEQLVQAIPTAGIQDELLNQLLQQLTLAKQKFTALTTDYGPQHSEVRMVSSQISELEKKVDARIKGLLQGLTLKVESLARGIADLNNEVARAQLADVSQAKTSRAISQAQRDLEDQEEIRKILLQKIASEKTEVQLPKTPPVQIVDPAFPSSRPSTPNRPRAIAFISSGALAAALGLLLARTGRAKLPASL